MHIGLHFEWNETNAKHLTYSRWWAVLFLPPFTNGAWCFSLYTGNSPLLGYFHKQNQKEKKKKTKSQGNNKLYPSLSKQWQTLWWCEELGKWETLGNCANCSGWGWMGRYPWWARSVCLHVFMCCPLGCCCLSDGAQNSRTALLLQKINRRSRMKSPVWTACPDTPLGCIHRGNSDAFSPLQKPRSKRGISKRHLMGLSFFRRETGDR